MLMAMHHHLLGRTLQGGPDKSHTCSAWPRKVVRQRRWASTLVGGRGHGHGQPLPPNSPLAWVHFGFSQGRPVPCNFYNAPPGSDVLCSTLHWVELRVTALQFAPPPLYWQTQNWLRHPIPARYHLPMMLRSVIFMLCCAMLATLYHPSNIIRFASTCYFHAISSTDNTSSS